jgi:hypothetical protein
MQYVVAFLHVHTSRLLAFVGDNTRRLRSSARLRLRPRPKPGGTCDRRHPACRRRKTKGLNTYAAARWWDGNERSSHLQRRRLKPMIDGMGWDLEKGESA